MVGIISLIISQIFIKVFGVLYSLYLTNKKGFGDEGNAIYMSGYQIYALLLTISSIGVPNAISKLISEKNSIKDYTNKERILKISLFIFGFIGFCGCIFLFFESQYIAVKVIEIPKASLSLMILSPAVFFVSMSSVFRGFCNGEGKIHITAKSQILEQIIKSLFTIIFVEVIDKISNSNTEIMAASANFATTFATFISFIYIMIKSLNMRKIINNINFPKERITYILKKILKTSIPITLCSIFTVLGKNIDSITIVKILKKIIGEKEAILKYGILSSKVDILIALPLAFNNSISTSLVPEISRLKARNEIGEIAKKIEISIIITIFICIPYCFGIFFYSTEIFALLFPKASNGAILLKIASFSLIFSMLTQTINSALQGLGKNNVPLIVSSIGIVIKLILNIILIPIPLFYEKGAIISTIISNGISLIMVYLYLYRNINIKINKHYLICPFIISSFMILFSKGLFKFLNNIIIYKRIITLITIFFSILFYGFIIIILKKILKSGIFESIENTKKI